MSKEHDGIENTSSESRRLLDEIYWLGELKYKRLSVAKECSVDFSSPETLRYLNVLDRLIQLQDRRLFSAFSLETHIEVLEYFERRLDEDRNNKLLEQMGGKDQVEATLGGDRKSISNQLNLVLRFDISEHRKLLGEFEARLASETLDQDAKVLLQEKIENQKGMIQTIEDHSNSKV